jgi:TonB-linked SusC/RagA family outer membrane protein
MKQIKKEYLKKSKPFSSSAFFLLFFACIFTANMRAQNVTGTVTDGKNEPLVGVSVLQKGTTLGTTTDPDGNFSIRLTEANPVLLFSYVGFRPEEINAAGKTSIQVTLYEDEQVLDEIVVVGFQSQKKVNLTGSVSAISADVFENRPVANIGQALQGLVPNLNIDMSNGAPNTAPSFNIRGGTSMSYNSDAGKYVVTNDAPLILVDGVELTPTLLNQMNPNDVESMSVIKDASAAAIYGTKATFGVILITTKSGKFNQKGKISYSYDLSWDTPSALPDILNAREIQEAAMNINRWTLGTVSPIDIKKLEAIKNYMANPTPENQYFMNGNTIVWVGNSNPYKKLVRNWTPMQKHNLSLSGGTDKIAYYLSLGYQNQEGMYNINTDEYNRYNALLRLTAKITDWFRVEGKVNYNRTAYEAPYIASYKGNIWSIMKNDADKNIMMPIMTGPNDPIPNTYTDNFAAWVAYGARTHATASTTLLSVSPEFIIIPKVLKLKADLSYTPQVSASSRKSPMHEYVTFSWASTVKEVSEVADNRAQLAKSSTDTYLVNIYADFNKSFRQKHNLAVIAGFSQESVDYSALTGDLRGLFSPNVLKPGAAEDESLHTISTGAQKRTGRALFGRINYNYAEKYLFEINGRYDGSSRFTPKERFFFFPSFSAGWRISEESFLNFASKWLSNLKIRGSWGKLGSQPDGYYPYQATMSSGSANFILDKKIVNTVKAPGLVSPTLTWEKAQTTNFGLDAGFLKSRLNLSLDVYRRKTTDVLTNGSVAYPSALGAEPPLENSGAIQTKGWELTAQWSDKRANGLRYDIGLILSDARTQVLHYAANPTRNIEQLYDGAYINDIWGYETGGILQNADLALNGNKYDFFGPYHTGNLYPGNVWYRDLNSDGLINSGSSTVENPGDRRIIGNSTPRYRYGITVGASWKNFDLSLFFQGIARRDLWIGSTSYWGSTTNGAGSKWMYDRAWTPERTDARFPRYLSGVSTQTAYLVNGAYFRMKQIVAGYTLPQLLTGKIGVDKVRFSLSAYNLFEITDIPQVFDPDQVSDKYPQKRTIAIGAQITF